MSANFQIRLLPQKEVIAAQAGQGLYQVLAEYGIFLRSDCGGRGTCGKCMVNIEGLGQTPGCRHIIEGDLTVEIPGSSLVVPEVTSKPALADEQLAGLQASESGYALAVDLGTTTMAIYLCDLAGVRIAASLSVRNPQFTFGPDVISRIASTTGNRRNLERLQRMAVRAVEWGVGSLLDDCKVAPDAVVRIVVVGNPAMLHLFLGEDPGSLGVSPFRPAFTEPRTVAAKSLGFAFDAEVVSLPLVSGFVGSDIVAAALATSLPEAEAGTMLVDIGTNGEIMLRGESKILATSCATGPAFEGATLSHGMPAVSGAIEAVRIDPGSGRAECRLVQHDPQRPREASGICGSGAVSVVAQLLRAGLLGPSGRLDPGLSRGVGGILEYELIGGESPVSFNQKDVRAIQLGKGALRTGIDLLCREAGLERPGKLLVAGAFGSHLSPQDAMDIGMFPRLPAGALKAVGNAAGLGAIRALFDPVFVERARRLAESCRVVNLAAQPDFQERFILNQDFPEPGR